MLISRFIFNILILKVNLHNIHLVKRSRTARALSHTVTDAIIHALVTEEVTASFEGRVFEVGAAHCAQGHGLFSTKVRT